MYDFSLFVIISRIYDFVAFYEIIKIACHNFLFDIVMLSMK